MSRDNTSGLGAVARNARRPLRRFRSGNTGTKRASEKTVRERLIVPDGSTVHLTTNECRRSTSKAEQAPTSRKCHFPTFRLDALWNVLALVRRQTDLGRCTPDLPWETSNRSP